jgi:hypothetical protein
VRRDERKRGYNARTRHASKAPEELSDETSSEIVSQIADDAAAAGDTSRRISN